MKNDVEQTIIQQIQPQCDSLYEKIKHEKDIQGETNKSVARHTGVSDSTVRNFFAGSLTNPCIFDVAAMCIHLYLSLDALMGIEPQDNTEKIKHLESQLERATSDLELVRHHNEILESGIKDRKPVIFGLTAVCFILAVALIGYLAMDVSNLNFGFITHDGVSVVGVIIMAALVLCAGFLTVRFIESKTKKRTGINDKNRSNN